MKGGKKVFHRRPVDVALTEELTGSLRTTRSKISGASSVVYDRFDSLHKRNLFEMGGGKGHKKKRRKVVEVKPNTVTVRDELK